MDEETNEVIQEAIEHLLENTESMVEIFGQLEEIRIKGKKGSKTSKEIYKKLKGVTDSEAEIFGLVELMKDNLKGSFAQEQEEQPDQPEDDSPF